MLIDYHDLIYMNIGIICFIYGGYKCLFKRESTKKEKRRGGVIAVLGYLFIAFKGNISFVRLYNNCYIINVLSI